MCLYKIKGIKNWSTVRSKASCNGVREREGEIEVIVLDTQMTNEMKQEIVYIVGWSQRRFNTISNDEYLTLLCRTQLPLLKGLSPLI